MGALGRQLAAFRGDAKGQVAVIVAIAVPVLALITCGAVDLTSLASDHSAMQDVADAAALAAAKQLDLGDPSSVNARTQSFADTMLGAIAERDQTHVSTALSTDGHSITVSIDGSRQSFFGNLLPPGGWTIHVQATAESLGRIPLCVLVHGSKDKPAKGVQGVVGQNLGGVKMQDTAHLTAPACLVHANDDVNVANTGLLQADLIQASGVAKGNMTPAGQSNAPPIDDPFIDTNVTIPGSCPSTPTPNVKITGATTLDAGVHCGGLQLSGDAILTLAPGEHYFVGDVTVDQNAQIIGDDVVLVFDKASKFDFKGASSVSLKGRRSGALAGFVVITTRDNGQTFHISATHVDQLLGTIYVPNAMLQVEGASKVGAASQWTVIVARQLQMNGGPNLVINANYAGSSVPVPSGVGLNTPVHVTLKR